VGFNSEIQGYNLYPMLHFHRKFSSSIISQWLLRGLLHYQTSYTNIVIIHPPTFISVCPLRQYTFYFILDV